MGSQTDRQTETDRQMDRDRRTCRETARDKENDRQTRSHLVTAHAANLYISQNQPHSKSGQHLTCDDCVDDKSEDYQNLILSTLFRLFCVWQSINQSSFISGMTERKPAMHKSNTHSNSSRVECLILVFIKHSCNEVGI